MFRESYHSMDQLSNFNIFVKLIQIQIRKHLEYESGPTLGEIELKTSSNKSHGMITLSISLYVGEFCLWFKYVQTAIDSPPMFNKKIFDLKVHVHEKF